MTLLTCKDLTIRYENTTVIRDLSFSVDEGDYLCIVGDNGAGKSTLLKCILGLKSYQAGSVTFAETFPKEKIGYVSQLDEVAPGTANYDTLLYGVECKYYSARPDVTDFELNDAKGIYALGDGAGFTRSLSQAAANGLIVADIILNKN